MAAFGGVVGGDGLHLAEAAGGDGRAGHAVFGEKIADRVGSAFGELLIEFIAANAVGVAFNLKRKAGMGENDAGDFGEFFAGARLKRVTAGVEKHVRHIHDEAAGGVAGLQNGIELAEKLGAQLGFFGFGLRGGLASLFGFGLGGSSISCGLSGRRFRGLLLG